MNFWDYVRSVIIFVAVVFFLVVAYDVSWPIAIITPVFGSVCVFHLIEMYHDFVRGRIKKDEEK
jgi:hypothetical protein